MGLSLGLMKIQTSLWVLFSACMLVLVQGCGTYASHLARKGANSPRIYRGTRYDAARLRDAIVAGEKDETHNDAELRTLIFIVMPIDLPLSFVADTLLLPYDIATVDEKE
jgi:uncharacterized protein YceK